MDNGYFIGYRIDVENTDLDMFDMTEGFEQKFDVDDLPGKEWMSWGNPGGGSSFLWMRGTGVDYRCPIDREELWKDLHSRTFDFPKDANLLFIKSI